MSVDLSTRSPYYKGMTVIEPPCWDFKQPSVLSEDGEKAYNAILKFLVKNDRTYTGGCKAFYSPKEWEIRGEKYGKGSVLIVVHDGGDLSPVFNLDYGDYTLSNKMNKALDKAGFYAESMTCWCTAIYKK